MHHTAPGRTSAAGSSRVLAGCVAVVVAAVVAVLGHPTSTSLTSLADALRTDHHSAVGEADGVVPDGTTVLDDVPAVANLDPHLLRALRRAATDAAEDGVRLTVNSGWRSAAYQEQLLSEAISTYGSAAAAARWVATPETSPHVSGDAVDIGSGAAEWLSAHGAAYGLCRIYANEPWHFELRPGAAGRGCPPPYADPTRDPRMQQ